ncbi:L,D-transpeptidase family protein [uncultured Selenomonas sp.]|uniref:L,D-transpeptidase family protein n=1 Tax=uncultured Selenomonas sp. TaxID=159275 RepID=UPI0025DFC2C5|nr:L,D-transpeptidase family protein [uncultured Selenomonas sp.]
MNKHHLTAAILSAALITTPFPVAFAAEQATPAATAATTSTTTAATPAAAPAATTPAATTQTTTATTTTTTTTQSTTAETPTDDEAVIDSRKISINLAARSLAVYEGQKRIRLYPIGPGKASTPTPVGYFKVESKDLNPTWTDPTDPEYSIPSGESNPLGYRWMEVQGNYGIHGTNKPESIGHYVSNGCIRMNEKDVEDVFDLVKVGTPIEITYNRIVVEKTPDDRVAFYVYPDGYGRQPLDVEEATKWLKGYGVQNFISDEDIEKKIEASDGEPTYIGKVYNITVDGKKLQNKAVEQDGITYLPAIDLADAAGVNLGWDEKSEVLFSTVGKATGYNKKDVLYCNADDVQTLFHLDGGLSGKQYVYHKMTTAPAAATTATTTTPAETNTTTVAPATAAPAATK